MKKTFISIALIGSLISSIAFAKNEHSLSLEASRISVDQESQGADFLGSDDQILPTLRYGYKFQMDQFFVRPSVSYTFGDIEIKDTDGTNDKSTVSQIITFEGDFGYEVMPNLNAFVTAGIVHASLEREVLGVKSDYDDMGYLYGLGLEYSVSDSVSVNAKYQHAIIDYGAGDSADLEADADLIKVGISYNF